MDDVLRDPFFFAAAMLLALLLFHQAAWLLVTRSRAAGRRLFSSPLWKHAHPLRALLQARFPRLAAWLGARVDPHETNGLPLTLLVLALGYTAFLIGGMIEELLEAEEIVAIDRTIDAWLVPYRQKPLLEVFIWLTDLGGSATLAGVALVTTGFFRAYGRSSLIAPLWISFIGAELTTWLGKWIFDRGRPEFITAVAPVSASFPSGHATGAMALYGFIAYAIIIDRPGLRDRFEIAYWALILILLIGFSRVFLSVHYASDVATGWLVGSFWVLAGITMAERRGGGP
jgi:undecaprenyl-diphosphatase